MKVGRPLKDRTGTRNGSLVIVERAPTVGRDSVWKCRCDCGAEILVRAGNLKRTHSCGCVKNKVTSARLTKHIGGQKFGKLTALKREGSSIHRKALWECQCECGTKKQIPSCALISGNTQSCGCIKSGIEVELYEFLLSLASDAKKNDRTVLAPKEIDILIPSASLGVELDGLHWHGQKHLESSGNDKFSSYHKFLACREKNVRLVTIFEDEWRDRQPLVKGYLSAILNKKETVGARKCQVVRTGVSEFLEQNHLQGSSRGEGYALQFEGRIIAAVAFDKPGPLKAKGLENCWELTRYCLGPDVSVAGGLLKLQAAFLKDHPECAHVLSYSDNRWSAGALYRAAGYEKVSESRPSFSYVRAGVRHHRFGYRKERAVALYGGSEHDTEWDIMSRNGWDRIWDCGKTRWVYRVPIS